MGKIIKKFRKERKMSQKKLAELTKVLNQSQISKIELGKRTVKEEEVLIFAKTFKVPIAKLYSMMNSFN